MRDCGILFEYFRNKNPEIDTSVFGNEFNNYLLTLEEFKDHGVYDQQKLEELRNFYEWYSDYYFKRAR